MKPSRFFVTISLVLSLIALCAADTPYTFQMSATASDDLFVDAAVAADGSAFLAGTTSGAVPGHAHAGAKDILVAHVHANGSLDWSLQTGTALDDEALAIVLDEPSATIYVAGYASGSLHAQPGLGAQDAVVIALDTNGTTKWTRLYGSSTDDRANDLLLVADRLFLAGYTSGTPTPNLADANKGGHDGWLMSLHLNGSVAWSLLKGGSGDDRFARLAYYQPTDTIYVSAITASTDGDVVGTALTTNWKTWLLRFDRNGTQLQQAVFQIDGVQNLGQNGLAVLDQDHVFLAGHSHGLHGSGAATPGANDSFVMRVDSNMNQIWRSQWGGSGDDFPGRLAFDLAQWRLWVPSTFTGPVPNATLAQSVIALFELHPETGRLLNEAYLGTSATDMAFGTINTPHGLYTWGSTTGSLPGFANQGNADPILFRSRDTTLCKPAKHWGRQPIRTTNEDRSFANTIQSNGVFVPGFDSSAALPGQTHVGGSDFAAVAYDRLGNQLWTYQSGSTANDFNLVMETGPDDSIYIGGTTLGSAFSASQGGYDAVVIKLNATGHQLWASQFGASADDQIRGIGVAADGALYVGGYSTGSLYGTHAGSVDLILRKLDPTTGNPIWSTQLGGTGMDYPVRMCIDQNQNLYIVGLTSSPSIDGQTHSGGTNDALVSAFDKNGTHIWTRFIGSTASDSAEGCAVLDGLLYVSGHTLGTLNGQTNAGANDIFLVALDPVSGSTRWTKLYGGTGDDLPVGRLVASDGYLLLSASSTNSFGGYTNTGDLDSIHIALSPVDGALLWVKGISSSNAGADTLREADLACDGTILASGSTSGVIELPVTGTVDGFAATTSSANVPPTLHGLPVLVHNPPTAFGAAHPLSIRDPDTMNLLMLVSCTPNCQTSFASASGNAYALAQAWSALNLGVSDYSINSTLTVAIYDGHVWANSSSTLAFGFSPSLTGLPATIDAAVTKLGATYPLTIGDSGGWNMTLTATCHYCTLSNTSFTGTATQLMALWSAVTVSFNNTRYNDTLSLTLSLASASATQSSAVRACPPTSLSSLQIGTTANDYSYHAIQNNAGELIVTILTQGSFPTYTNAGDWDVVVQKYGTDGSLLWTRQTGSTAQDNPYKVAVDAADNIYVVGIADATFNGQPLTGTRDVFLMKLDTLGNTLFTKLYGSGSSIPFVVAITADQQRALIGGKTTGTLGGANGGADDVFVLAVNVTNGAILSSGQVAAAGAQSTWAGCMDDHDNLYVVGGTAASMDGQPFAGSNDAFAVKFNAAAQKQWVKLTGAAGSDLFHGCVAHNDMLFVAGSENGNAIVAMRQDTGAIQWTTPLIENADLVIGIDVSPGGTIIAAGRTSGSLPGFTNAGSSDYYVLHALPNNGSVVWYSQYGSSGGETAQAMTTTCKPQALVAGSTAGALHGSNAGAADAFVSVIDIPNIAPVLTGLSQSISVHTTDLGAAHPITIMDDNRILTLTLSCTSCTLSRTSLEGTAAQLASQWAQVTSSFPVPDTLTVQLSDGQLTTVQHIAIVNFSPTLSGLPATLDYTVTNLGALYPINITDDTPLTLTLNISCSFCTLSNTSFTGTPAQLQVLWTQVTVAFAPDHANDTLTLLLSDGFSSAQQSASVRGGCDSAGPNLVIQYGTTASDTGYGVAFDAYGNVYVTGNTAGSLPGFTNAGGQDMYTIKYDRHGAVQWRYQVGSANDDYATGVAVDLDGNVFVVGFAFGSIDGQAYGGSYEMVAYKLDKDGNKLWTRMYGNAGTDLLYHVAVSSDLQHIYVAGQTESFAPGGAGSHDAYTAKLLTSNGNIVWQQVLGGTLDDTTTGFARDADENLYQCGYTNSASFDGIAIIGSFDVYVFKRDKDGNKLWSKRYGTTAGDYCKRLDVRAGRVVLSADIGAATFNGQNVGGASHGLLVLNATTGDMLWSDLQRSTADTYAEGVGLTSTNLIATTGVTVGSFPGYNNAGGNDWFLSIYTLDGTRVDRRQFGSTGADALRYMATGCDGQIAVSGSAGASMLGQPVIGGGDAFVWTERVNIAPTLTNLPARVLASTPLYGSQQPLTIHDYEDDVIQFTVSCTRCNVNGTGTPSVTLSGRAAELNAAWLTMSVTFDASYANDTVTWTVADAWHTTSSRRQVEACTYPRVQRVAHFGGSGNDNGESVTVDRFGNIYVGSTTTGSLGSANAGGWDAYARKMDYLGNALWTKQWGSAGTEHVYSVVVDLDENVYLGGTTTTTLVGTHLGGNDGFLIKLDKNGNQLWAKQVGSTGSDDLRALLIDPDGKHFYAVGLSASTTWTGRTGYGSHDFVWVKYTTSDCAFVVGAQGGGAADDWMRGAALDEHGNVYMSGYTTASVNGQPYAGSNDFLTIKFDRDGNVVWTRMFGGTGSDVVHRMTYHKGMVFVDGYVNSDVNGVQRIGGQDAAVVAYNATTGDLLWNNVFGTHALDYSHGVAVTSGGVLVAAGLTQGYTPYNDYGTSNDVFYALIEATTGRVLKYVQQALAGDDYPRHAVCNCHDQVVISGGSGSSWPDGYTNQGSYDLFVWVADANAPPEVSGLPNKIEASLGSWNAAASPLTIVDVDTSVLSMNVSCAYCNVNGTGVLLQTSGTPAQLMALWKTLTFTLDATRDNDTLSVSLNDGFTTARVHVPVVACLGPRSTLDAVILQTSADDRAWGSNVDRQNNLYIASSTSGALAGSAIGDWDAYVRKMDRNGVTLWQTQFGTTSTDYGYSIDTDSLGNMYVGGATSGSLFHANFGGQDAFMVKFDVNGNVMWQKQYGSASTDDFRADAVVTPDGKFVYTAGYTASSFHGDTALGSNDFLIVKVDTETGNLVWSRQCGGSGDDVAHGLTMDDEGNIYVVGYTSSNPFNGVATNGGYDYGIVKYSPDGAIIWSATVGSTTTDYGYRVAYDNGRVFVNGVVNGAVNGVPLIGGQDNMVVALNASTGALLWNKMLGTTTTDEGWGVAVAPSGLVGVFGDVGGTLTGVNNPNGGQDAYYALLHPVTGELLYEFQYADNTGTLLPRAASMNCFSQMFMTGATTGNFAGVANQGSYQAFGWMREANAPPQISGLPTSFASSIAQVGTTYPLLIKDFEDADMNMTVVCAHCNVNGTGSTTLVVRGKAAQLMSAWSTISVVFSNDYANDSLTVSVNDGFNTVSDSSLIISCFLPKPEPRYIQFGTSSDDRAYSSTVDREGNLIIAAHTTGALATANAGGWDNYIRKYDPTGTQVAWTIQRGGTGTEAIHEVTTDAAGNIYWVGYTNGAFPGFAHAGSNDFLMGKVSPTGQWVWTRQMGTAANEVLHGVGMSPDDEHMYVFGYSSGTIGGANAGSEDLYLGKYKASDGATVWQRQLGVSASDIFLNGVVDENEFVYGVGRVTGALNGQTFAGGSYDVVLVKYDKDGNHQYTRLWGGASNEEAYRVTLVPGGRLAVAGYTDSNPFAGQASLGGRDGFVVMVNRTTGDTAWVRMVGTDKTDTLHAISSLPNGLVAAGGDSGGDVSLGNQAGGNGNDAAVFVLDADTGTLQFARQLSLYGTTFFTDATSTCHNQVFFTGRANVALPGNTASGSWDPMGWLMDVDVPPTVTGMPATMANTETFVTSNYPLTISDYENYGTMQLTVSCGNCNVNGTGLQSKTMQGNSAQLMAAWLGMSITFDTSLGNDTLYARVFDGVNTVAAQTAVTGCSAVKPADWTLQFGTGSNEDAYSSTWDHEGNLLVGANTYGSLYATIQGGNDWYVAKFSPQGTLLWGRQYGTSANDAVHDIDVDDHSNVYAGGYTGGTLFDTALGSNDFAAVKFDRDGNMIWRKQWGSSGNDVLHGVAVSTDNTHVFMAGYTGGSLGAANAGGVDYVVMKMTAHDGAVLWYRQVGSAGSDHVIDMDIDAMDNLYLIGYGQGSIHGQPYQGSEESAVLSYDKDGNHRWTRMIGTSGSDTFYRGQQSNGVLYATGHIRASVSGQPYSGGASDVFVVAYNATDGTELFVRLAGTDNEDWAHGLTVTPTGLVVVGGDTRGSLAGFESPNTNLDMAYWVWDTQGNFQYHHQWIDVTSNSQTRNAESDCHSRVAFTGYAASAMAGQTAYGGNDAAVRVTSVDVPPTVTGLPLTFDEASMAAGRYPLAIADFEDFATTQLVVSCESCNVNGTGSNRVVVQGKVAHLMAAWMTMRVDVDTATTSNDTLVVSVFDGVNTVTQRMALLVCLDNSGMRNFLSQYGTSGTDNGYSVTVDREGGILIGSHTYGALGAANAGSADAYVRKYSRTGEMLWTWQQGGAGNDVVHAVATDNDLNVYAVGYATAAFPGCSYVGSNDFLIVKLNQHGVRQWAVMYGSTGNDVLHGVVVTKDGSAIVVSGYTDGNVAGTNLGGMDWPVMKLRTSDGAKVWQRQIGTANHEHSHWSVIDEEDNVYIFGNSQGAFGGKTNAGAYDMAVAKLDTNGNTVWTWLAGSNLDDSLSRGYYSNGMVYGAGYSQGTGVLGDQVQPGAADMAVVKINATTGVASWLRLLGGPSNDYAHAVVVNKYGTVLAGELSTSRMDGFSAPNSEDMAYYLLDADGNKRYEYMDVLPGIHKIRTAHMLCGDNNLAVAAGDTTTALPGQSLAGGWDAYVRTLAVDAPPILRGLPSSVSSTQSAFGQAHTLRIDDPDSPVLNMTVSCTQCVLNGTGGTSLTVTGSRLQLEAAWKTLSATFSQDPAVHEAVVVTVSDLYSSRDHVMSVLACAGVQPTWSQQIGTTSSDYLRGMARDGFGNLYVTGMATAAFPGKAFGGTRDVILIKYNSTGAEQWVVQDNHAGLQDPYEVWADSRGYVYVTGLTQQSYHGQAFAGSNDVFVNKYRASDGVRLWTGVIGSTSSDVPQSIWGSADGKAVYVAGYTSGALSGEGNAGSQDGFLAKFGTVNGIPEWVRRQGTAGAETTFSVTVDEDANAYATGRTSGALYGSNAGLNDVYVLKVNPDGLPLWTVQFGGTGAEPLDDIPVLVHKGVAFVAGSTGSTTLNGQTATNGAPFVVALDANTGAQLWTSIVATVTSTTYVNGVSMTPSGHLVVGGYTQGTMNGQVSAGSNDLWYAVLDTAQNGSVLVVKQFGTSGADVAQGLAVTCAGEVVLSGYTTGVFGEANAGGYDFFVVKRDLDRPPEVALSTTRFEVTSGDTVVLGERLSANVTQLTFGVEVPRVYLQVSCVECTMWMPAVTTLVNGSVMVVANSTGMSTVAEVTANVTQVQAWLRSLHVRFNGSNADEPITLKLNNVGNTGANDVREYVVNVDVLCGDVTPFLVRQGTASNEVAQAVAVDRYGDVAMAGYSDAALAGAHSGSADAFVRVWNSQGSGGWQVQFGTAGADVANDVVYLSDGGVLVAGYVSGALFGQTYNGGGRDAFVARYSSTGAQMWFRLVGSSGNDEASSMQLSTSQEYVYVVGYAMGAVNGAANNGGMDVLAFKMRVSNGSVEWTSQHGAGGNDVAERVSLTMDGTTLMVAGSTTAEVHGQPYQGGSNDALVMALRSSDGTRVWTRTYGGDSADVVTLGRAVVVQDLFVVSGSTDSSVFLGMDALGNADAFVVAVHVANGNVAWKQRVGTAALDQAMSIALMSNNVLVVAAVTQGALPGQSSQGGQDIAYLYMDAFSGQLLRTEQVGGSGLDTVQDVAVTCTGDVASVGMTQSTNGMFAGTSASGNNDVFAAVRTGYRSPPSVVGLTDARLSVFPDQVLHVGVTLPVSIHGVSLPGDGVDVSCTACVLTLAPAANAVAGVSVSGNGTTRVTLRLTGAAQNGSALTAVWSHLHVMVALGAGGPVDALVVDTVSSTSSLAAGETRRYTVPLAVPCAPLEPFRRRVGTSNGEWTERLRLGHDGSLYTAGGTSLNAADALMRKFNASGVQVWENQFVNAGGSWGHYAVPDNRGSVFVSSNFIGNYGSLVNSGGTDTLMAKLDDTNGKVEWARLLGSSVGEAWNLVELSDDGQYLYLVVARDDSRNLEVSKFHAASGELVWSQLHAGNGTVAGHGLRVAPNGDVVAGGFLIGAMFGTSSQPGNVQDAWVARFNGSNGDLVWSHVFGGYGTYDWVHDVVFLTDETSNDVVITGMTNGNVTLPASMAGAPVTAWPVIHGGDDGFVMRLGAMDGKPKWVTVLDQSAANELGHGVAVALGDDGLLYTSGRSQDDLALWRLTREGTLVDSLTLGGPTVEWSKGVVRSCNGLVYVSGSTHGAFPGIDTPHAGGEDMVLLALQTATFGPVVNFTQPSTSLTLLEGVDATIKATASDLDRSIFYGVPRPYAVNVTCEACTLHALWMPGANQMMEGNGTSTLRFMAHEAEFNAWMGGAGVRYVQWNESNVAVDTVRIGMRQYDGVASVASLPVVVTLVNDPVHVLTGLPSGLYNVSEESALPFGISVSDVDAVLGDLSVHAEASLGTLRVFAGVTFAGAQVSGNDTHVLNFNGTLAQVNAALLSMEYLAGSLPGLDIVRVVVSDNGAGGIGEVSTRTFVFNVTIPNSGNDPVRFVHLPPSWFTVAEDSSFHVPFMRVADPDAAAGVLTLNVSATLGTVELAAGAAGNGSVVVNNGTLTQINALLTTLVYHAPVHHVGGDTVTVVVNDNGFTGGPATQAVFVLTVNVTAVNDPVHIVGMPTELTVDYLDSVHVAGISVTDVDAAQVDGNMRLVISATHGRLSTVSHPDKLQIDVVGTLGSINAQLATLHYASVPGLSSGVDPLVVSVYDLGNHGAGPAYSRQAVVNVTVAPFVPTLTFVGAAGGDWNVSANWDAGRVPNATDSVLVPANASVVLSQATVARVDRALAWGNVTVLSGSVLEIVRGAALAGDTHVHGTGSVVQGAFTGVAQDPQLWMNTVTLSEGGGVSGNTTQLRVVNILTSNNGVLSVGVSTQVLNARVPAGGVLQVNTDVQVTGVLDMASNAWLRGNGVTTLTGADLGGSMHTLSQARVSSHVHAFGSMAVHNLVCDSNAIVSIYGEASLYGSVNGTAGACELRVMAGANVTLDGVATMNSKVTIMHGATLKGNPAAQPPLRAFAAWHVEGQTSRLRLHVTASTVTWLSNAVLDDLVVAQGGEVRVHNTGARFDAVHIGQGGTLRVHGSMQVGTLTLLSGTWEVLGSVKMLGALDLRDGSFLRHANATVYLDTPVSFGVDAQGK